MQGVGTAAGKLLYPVGNHYLPVACIACGHRHIFKCNKHVLKNEDKKFWRKDEKFSREKLFST
jgi:hypothetical protein